METLKLIPAKDSYGNKMTYSWPDIFLFTAFVWKCTRLCFVLSSWHGSRTKVANFASGALVAWETGCCTPWLCARYVVSFFFKGLQQRFRMPLKRVTCAKAACSPFDGESDKILTCKAVCTGCTCLRFASRQSYWGCDNWIVNFLQLKFVEHGKNRKNNM